MKTLNMLQNIFVGLAGAMILYIGGLVGFLPAVYSLLHILKAIPQLQMPYLFFGYIFLFWMFSLIFGVAFKCAMWFIDNNQVKKENV